MTLRELLGVTLREEGKGLLSVVQVVGYAVYLVLVAGLTYVGRMMLDPCGGVVGVVVGVALGFGVSAGLSPGYPARQGTRA